MKILGGVLLIWGLGVSAAAAFNYWIWLSLRGSVATLTGADRAFVEGNGHGFFISFILVGVVLAAGGVKLIRLKPRPD